MESGVNAEDAFTVLFRDWKRDSDARVKVYAIANAIADAALRFDEYQPDPRPRPIGHTKDGKQIHVVWAGQHWTINDALKLLVQTEERRVALQCHNAREHLYEDTVDRLREETLKAITTMDMYMSAVFAWPIEAQDDLLFTLILIGMHVDQRAERACCKYSNVLARLHLSAPSKVKILSLRARLFEPLKARIEGRLTHLAFAASLRQIAMVGSASLELEEPNTYRTPFYATDISELASSNHFLFHLSLPA